MPEPTRPTIASWLCPPISQGGSPNGVGSPFRYPDIDERVRFDGGLWQVETVDGVHPWISAEMHQFVLISATAPTHLDGSQSRDKRHQISHHIMPCP